MKHVQSGTLSFSGGTMTIERDGKVEASSLTSVAQVMCSCGWVSVGATTVDGALAQLTAHQAANKKRRTP